MWCKIVVKLKKRDHSWWEDIPDAIVNDDKLLKKFIKTVTNIFRPLDVEVYPEEELNVEGILNGQEVC